MHFAFTRSICLVSAILICACSSEPTSVTQALDPAFECQDRRVQTFREVKRRANKIKESYSLYYTVTGPKPIVDVIAKKKAKLHFHLSYESARDWVNIQRCDDLDPMKAPLDYIVSSRDWGCNIEFQDSCAGGVLSVGVRPQTGVQWRVDNSPGAGVSATLPAGEVPTEPVEVSLKGLRAGTRDFNGLSFSDENLKIALSAFRGNRFVGTIESLRDAIQVHRVRLEVGDRYHEFTPATAQSLVPFQSTSFQIGKFDVGDLDPGFWTVEDLNARLRVGVIVEYSINGRGHRLIDSSMITIRSTLPAAFVNAWTL